MLKSSLILLRSNVNNNVGGSKLETTCRCFVCYMTSMIRPKLLCNKKCTFTYACTSKQ